MAPRKGRHPRRGKGPGGPRRTSRVGHAEVIPITRAPGARSHEGLLRPSIEGLVRSLLTSLRTLAPEDPESRPIGIEVWADRMAATVYGAEQMPADFYADLAEGMLSSSDPDARPALAALALVLEHDEAADLRAAHADHRAGLEADDPTDLGIGRATPRRAFEISHVQGDGVTLLLELDQPGAPHCVGVYIDHTLGGLAKDLLVGPPWSAVEQMYREGPGLTVREVALADVRARYAAAIDLTDHTVDPPVADDFDDTRPLVERRLALLPDGGAVPALPAPDDEAVEELVAAFLASPEAEGLPAHDQDEAGWLVDLWIHHATGEALGGPFRLSPMLVEVFCTDWYPHHAAADPEAAAAAPAVLSAWARHAARLDDLDHVWLDQALAAIATFAPTMTGEPPRGGIGGGLHDELDPQLRDALRPGPEDDGRSLSDLERELADGTWMHGAPGDVEHSWTGLQPPRPGSRPVEWDADTSRVVPEVATKVELICLRCRALAEALLGPDYVRPAIDLALRIGEVEPSPLPHTQDQAWAAAVVWLLADDNGAFDPHTPGRTRDDLAGALPFARATTTRRATEIRQLLGLTEGDLSLER